MNTQKMAKYDRMICKFEYSRALDAVMLSFIANKCTSISVGVLQELIRWGERERETDEITNENQEKYHIAYDDNKWVCNIVSLCVFSRPGAEVLGQQWPAGM